MSTVHLTQNDLITLEEAVIEDDQMVLSRATA